MTLTEEQREAIHAVSGLLTAVGCPQCHYYIRKNYTHHIEVLRAMVDISEHFSDATKMIGFDMEKARASIAHYRIENPSNVDTESALKELVDQANLAEDALAEIERLQGFETAARDLNNDLTRIAGERDDLAAQIQEMQAELVRVNQLREIEIDQVGAAIVAMAEGAKQHVLKTHTIMKNVFDEADSLAGYCEELENIVITKDARIKALKADLEQSERVIEARLEVIDQQAARIKSLKKEIRRLKHESKVEQEFTNSYIKRLHDAEARIKELGSSLDEAEALTKQNAELMNGYLRRIAELEDALVEGLTNFLHYRASCYDPARRCPYAKECDDCSTWDACGHVEKFRSEARRQLQAEGKIGPDAKPRVWQITEERKAAIWHAVAVLKENDPDDEHLWDEEIAVLRAMLREAE